MWRGCLRWWVLGLLMLSACSGDLEVPWQSPDAPAGWWDDGWHARIPLSVRSSLVTAPVNPPPMLVVLTGERVGDLTLSPDGADVRIVDTDTGNTVPFEIDTWEPGGDHLVWVRWPELAPPDVRTLYLYLDNPTAAAPAPEPVWPAEAVGVWHFSAADPLADSAGGGHDLQAMGGLPSSTEQRIGAVATFNGSDGYYLVSSEQGYEAPRVTVSAWVRTTSTIEASVLESFAPSSSEWVFTLEDPNGAVLFSDSQNENDNQASTTGVSDGAWHHIAAVSAPDPQQIQIYIDGAPASSSLHPNEGWTKLGSLPAIGSDHENPPQGDDVFDGEIDEARVLGAAMNDLWIALDHASSADEALDYGAIERW